MAIESAVSSDFRSSIRSSIVKRVLDCRISGVLKVDQNQTHQIIDPFLFFPTISKMHLKTQAKKFV